MLHLIRLRRDAAATASPPRAFLVCLQTDLVSILSFFLSPSETFQISLTSPCRGRVNAILTRRGIVNRHCKMPLTERDVNIRHKSRTRTPPAHKTPQPHSKLPRFVATPNSAPAASKWTPRTVSPADNVERTGSALRHTPINNKHVAATAHAASSQKV